MKREANVKYSFAKKTQVSRGERRHHKEDFTKFFIYLLNRLLHKWNDKININVGILQSFTLWMHLERGKRKEKNKGKEMIEKGKGK